jgi:hypothetical protein
MIIGRDTKFEFNDSNFNVQLKKLEIRNRPSSSCKSFVKELESNSFELCFGIPELSKLDRSNESLTIGHHFYNDQENVHSAGLFTFSYCLKKKQYVNLPDFDFYVFIITYNSNSDNYGILPFKNKKSKWPKVTLNQMPKFNSLYSTGESKCGQVYLKQKFKGIKMKYAQCINDSSNSDSPGKLHELENRPNHAYFHADHDGNINIFFLNLLNLLILLIK